MRYIGDQLSFHALAAQPLIYGTLHALLHFIQVLAAPLQIAPQKTRIHRLTVIALRQCLGAALQGSKSDGNIQCKYRQQQIQQEHGQRKHRHIAADSKRKDKSSQNDQRRPPYERNGAHQMTDPPANGFQNPPQQLNGVPDDIVLQHRSRLAPCNKGDKEQENAVQYGSAPQSHRNGGSIVVVINKKTSGKHKDNCHQIQRDLIKPCQVNTLKSLPVTGGSHLPEEAEQRQHHEQHCQRDKGIFHIQQP